MGNARSAIAATAAGKERRERTMDDKVKKAGKCNTIEDDASPPL
jgi:hypothetical protein